MVDSGNYCVKVVATNQNLGGIAMNDKMKALQEMQANLNSAREEYNFDWNYFPVREIWYGLGLYAIGARLEFDGSITYISCDEDCTPDSIKIVSMK